MMQEIALNIGNGDRSDEDEIAGLPRERWPPLGAPSSLETSFHSDGRPDASPVDCERLRQLEEEQEQLNASLLALTSHFAQVQFRLQQICKASTQEKEALLKELEEFAFRGCLDLGEVKKMQRERSIDEGDISAAEHEELMKSQRYKQIQLISQLKEQLQDLEQFAYMSGESGLPSSEVMAKQQVIIDHLREKMNLDLHQFDSLTPQELQTHVDEALKQLIKPIKVKDQIVQQLRTQVTDLERYIEFLQADGTNGSAGNRAACTCSEESGQSTCPLHGIASSKQKGFGYTREDKFNQNGIIGQTATFLQLYLLAYLGCGGRKFQKNQLKRTPVGNHWGDLRAALEVAIKCTVDVVEKHKGDETPATLNPCSGEEEEELDDVFRSCPEEIVCVVRKQLCPALRDLLQHGLMNPAYGARSLVPIGCFPSRSQKLQVDSNVHAWDVIVKYYEMKHGKEYSEAPVRKLSQSFNLDSIGGKAITSKQILLSTIDNVIITHTKLKRSPDAMFKAFVCAAMNHKKLVAWLRMILRTREIVDEHYAPWSYVIRTGFDDACGSLEKLNRYTFCLPYDLAVRPFQNIKDAF